MIQEYETEVCGAPFAESEKPSDTQVSACRGRIIADDNPTPCFGRVGPFGDRAEMGMANAGDIEIDGVKTRRRYKGPDDHPRWNGCWRIFGSCMMVCKASPKGPLDIYEKNILVLYIRFPRIFRLLAKVEQICRYEMWPKYRLLLDEMVAAGHAPKYYNKD